jgi:hypothetical protein
MATTAKLNVVFGADLKDFQKGMAQAQRGLADFGKKMTAVGVGLTKTLTLPIVGFLGASTRAFTKQEDAERKLAAAIGATGGAVDSNMKRFKAFASEMQRLTVVGDETTLELLQVATSMGLTAEQAERAAKNAIALQSAHNVAATSAIRMTSALEQGDATLLRRTIPSLKLAEDNTLAVAQAQQTLTQSFKVAEEEAKTFGGQVTQLKMAFGDFMEAIGSVVAEVLTPFVAKAKEVVKSLQNMDRELLKFRVGVVAIIAVVPILMVAIGKLSIAFATLNRVMMANPYVLLATGIGMVLFGAFVKFREESIKTETRLRAIKEGMEAQKTSVDDLVRSLKDLDKQEARRNLLEELRKQDQYVESLKKEAEALKANKRERTQSLNLNFSGVTANLTDKQKELNLEIDKNNSLIEEAVDRLNELRTAYLQTASASETLTKANKKQNDELKAYIERVNEIQKIDQITGVATTPEQRAALDRYNNSLSFMGSRLRQVSVQSAPIPQSLTNMQKVMIDTQPIVDNFVGSFGDGMANVVVQGERLVDVLKNIGKLLLSSAIQTGLKILLTGGLKSAGEGFFGEKGGVFGSLITALTRSGGGRVQAGQPYMTGEIGSELFIPSTNGSIISHRQLQGLGGQAQPVQVNVNVSGKISGRDLVFLVDNNRRTFN